MKTALLLLATAFTVLAAPTEEDAVQEFTNGNRRFSAGLYRELLKVNSGNVLVSPLSSQTILALTREGARGESAAELASGLSLPSTNEKIQQAFETFLPKLSSKQQSVKLSTANRIYVSEEVKLEDEFKQVAENVYEAGIENVNFADNTAAAEKINQWVEQRTRRKIKKLIDPETIGANTNLILVNALYFRGVWESPFDSEDTEKKKFHTLNGDVKDVDMMQQTGSFRYYENTDLNTKFLELSYLNSNVSMIFILPNERNGLTTLEQNIEDIFAPQPFRTERIEVQIPKFKVETSIKMIPILQELGIKEIFSKGAADLSGLSSTHKGLFISGVIQKVFIDVNESGTEAAATTAEISLSRMLPARPKAVFIADHPFAFYIQYNGVILFTGRYTN